MTRRLTCHCGRVAIEVELGEDLSQARRCDCSYCSRRGAVMLGVPLDALRIVKGADNLALYEWGTGIAKHYFCKTCGIYTHHRRRSNPNEYGINVACLDGVSLRELGAIGWTDGINHPSDRP